MHTSVSLLRSGLEEIVRDRINTTGPPTSEILFRCCFIGVSAMWENHISQSLSSLMATYCCLSGDDNPINQVVGTAFCNEIDDTKLNLDSKFSVARGDKGRMVLSEHGDDIYKNYLVLSDRAYMCTTVAACECHEGAILVEHFVMAWGMMNSLHSKIARRTDIRSSSSSCDKNYESVASDKSDESIITNNNNGNCNVCNFVDNAVNGRDNLNSNYCADRRSFTVSSNNNISTDFNFELFKIFLRNVQSGLIESSFQFDDSRTKYRSNEFDDNHNAMDSKCKPSDKSPVNVPHEKKFDADGIWPLHLHKDMI